MKSLLSLILGLSLIFISHEVNSQQLEYDIIWLGKIGKLHISKTQKEAESTIETSSEVKIPFYKLNWITSTSVIDGQLQSSNYAQLLNNKKREFTDIDYITDDNWQIINDNGQNELIKIRHKFNVSDLYFEEPVDEQFIFSERYGRPFELVNKGNGQYRLLLPDKNYSDYFYDDGVCTIVKAKSGTKTFRFVLNDKG